MPPKSNSQRQANLRQRRSEEGLIEVRNIYAKPEDHKKIKDFANSVVKNNPTSKTTNTTKG